jgi:hypothetical protein
VLPGHFNEGVGVKVCVLTLGKYANQLMSRPLPETSVSAKNQSRDADLDARSVWERILQRDTRPWEDGVFQDLREDKARLSIQEDMGRDIPRTHLDGTVAERSLMRRHVRAAWYHSVTQVSGLMGGGDGTVLRMAGSTVNLEPGSLEIAGVVSGDGKSLARKLLPW